MSDDDKVDIILDSLNDNSWEIAYTSNDKLHHLIKISETNKPVLNDNEIYVLACNKELSPRPQLYPPSGYTKSKSVCKDCLLLMKKRPQIYGYTYEHYDKFFGDKEIMFYEYHEPN
jgi:superfamily I DNA and/or RNA helicase